MLSARAQPRRLDYKSIWSSQTENHSDSKAHRGLGNDQDHRTHSTTRLRRVLSRLADRNVRVYQRRPQERPSRFFATAASAQNDTRTGGGGDIARLQLEAQNPHLPAAAPAGRLSRKSNWRGKFPAPSVTPQKNLRAKGRPRHFATCIGYRGHPCPRRRGTHGGFHIQSSDLPFPTRTTVVSAVETPRRGS
jgi:hypothetical protein